LTELDDPNGDGYGAPRSLNQIEGIGNAMIDIDLYFPKLDMGGYGYESPQESGETVIEIARKAEIIT
jgi:hypothetical protein